MGLLDTAQQTQRQLEQVKGQMADNVSRAIDNAGDMEALGAKTDELHTAAAQFKTTATTAKWQECRKNAQVPLPPGCPASGCPASAPLLLLLPDSTPPHSPRSARWPLQARGRTHGVG